VAQAETIKVVVIYRNQVARAGLMAGFGQYRDIQVVQAGAVREACGSGESSGEEVADVVVADYDAGIAYMERSRAQSSLAQASKVMIVTASDGESDIRYALGRGARGYMLLDSDFDDLAHGVREVHMGVRALSRRIAQQLAEIVTAEGLSSREMEVLRYLVEGLGNKLIARRLDIAVETVKSHLKSIFEKLQVESRTQAIVVATRRGLLSHH
jgi:DNA-binding NarL/FixJ family response regulator